LAISPSRPIAAIEALKNRPALTAGYQSDTCRSPLPDVRLLVGQSSRKTSI